MNIKDCSEFFFLLWSIQCTRHGAEEYMCVCGFFGGEGHILYCTHRLSTGVAADNFRFAHEEYFI